MPGLVFPSPKSSLFPTWVNKRENLCLPVGLVSNPFGSFCAPGIKKPIGEVSNLLLFTQTENRKLGLACLPHLSEYLMPLTVQIMPLTVQILNNLSQIANHLPKKDPLLSRPVQPSQSRSVVFDPLRFDLLSGVIITTCFSYAEFFLPLQVQPLDHFRCWGREGKTR